MHVHFYCPEGHKIKAKQELAGKSGKCPRCNTPILVPEAATADASHLLPQTRAAITESGVMRILGDAAPPPPMPEPSQQAKRSCPRCRKQLPQTMTVCDQCQLYVGLLTAKDFNSSSIWNSSSEN